MNDCWIDPKGQIYEVPDFGHNDFAYEYLEKQIGFEEMMKIKGIRSAYSILHDMGWVRVKYNTSYAPKVEILGDCIDLTKPQKNTIDPAMNSIQLRVAKQICDEIGEDFHRAINDKRWW